MTSLYTSSAISASAGAKPWSGEFKSKSLMLALISPAVGKYLENSDSSGHVRIF